jgi:hypothetical protein
LLIAVVGINAALALPLRLFERVLAGYQRFDLVNAARVVYAVINAALTILALETGFGVVGLAVANTVGALASYAVQAAMVHAIDPEFRISRRGLSRGDAWTMTKLSMALLVIGLAWHAILTTDQLLIGAFLGLAAVAPYAVARNLGTVREDENAMWNFAPHDISVILYLLGQVPTDVSARGQCYLQEGIHDVVFLSMNFAGAAMAHVHVSWLDPHKTRKLTIVGSKKMAVFDDLEPNEKLKIYDKGAQINLNYNRFAEYVGLRFGDITIPHIRAAEPLQIECEHFLACVRDRRQPRSDGHDGLRVVQVLAAGDKSLKLNGSPVPIGIAEH